MTNKLICGCELTNLEIRSNYLKQTLLSESYTCLVHHYRCPCDRDNPEIEPEFWDEIWHWNELNDFLSFDILYRRYKFHHRIIQNWHYAPIFKKFNLTRQDIEKAIHRKLIDNWLYDLYVLPIFQLIKFNQWLQSLADFSHEKWYTFNCWPHQPEIDPYLEQEEIFAAKCGIPCPIAQNPQSSIPCQKCTLKYANK